MPEFPNPFSGKTPDRKLTNEELIRAIRLNLAAEQEAVHLYMAHADATDHPLAKAVLKDIADEERVHAGEFHRLLEILTGDESKFMEEGYEEVNELAEEIGYKTSDAKPEEADIEDTTIGSLKEE